MRKLTPKNYDKTKFDELIFTQSGSIKSHLNLTEDNITDVKSRFTDYESNKNNLENVSPSTYSSDSNEYKSLFGLYDSVSEDTKNLKNEIKEISGVKCPYCGISEPSHLDHFLPRAKFSEFSIYAQNLIYVCSICNSTCKGDDVVTSTGERKFFNPYFDDFIETTQFLKCDIKLDGSLYPFFKFYIEDLSATIPYEYTVMKNHFEAMHLQTRYMEQIAKEKFIRFKNRYKNKDVSLEKLKENIDYELNGLNNENFNNWEKVFWESLKNCDECLNLITNKKIS